MHLTNRRTVPDGPPPPLGYAPPMPLPDGPTLFVIAVAVMLPLTWWATRDTGD